MSSFTKSPLFDTHCAALVTALTKILIAVKVTPVAMSTNSLMAQPGQQLQGVARASISKIESQHTQTMEDALLASAALLALP